MKALKQIFLYSIEIFIVVGLLTFLSIKIYKAENVFQIIERFMLFYAIYQLVVILILNNINDMERDSCIAYETALKLCIEYKRNNDEKLYKLIINRIEEQLKNTTANNKKYYKRYQLLKENLITISEETLKQDLIFAELSEKMCSLQWRYSFLLRLVK